MQSGQRIKFASQVSPELLAALRKIARSDGRHFQAVLEDAMASYIEARVQHRVCPEVMARYRASLERNRLLLQAAGQVTRGFPTIEEVVAKYDDLLTQFGGSRGRPRLVNGNKSTAVRAGSRAAPCCETCVFSRHRTSRRAAG